MIDLATALGAAIGAGLVQLGAELVVKPLRSRKVIEQVADAAAAKAIEAHESSCTARHFVAPLGGDLTGG